ncbi:hypothetical protein LCGC14_2880630, partial [marine sediment metagenome]
NKGGAGCGCRHSDIRGFSTGISSPLSYFGFRSAWSGWEIKRKPLPIDNVYPPLEDPAHRCVPRIRRAAGTQYWWLHLSALEDHLSGLVRLWRITPSRPIFKNTLGQPRLPVPKSRIFRQFAAKWLLDNTIFIRYLNFGCLKSFVTCCRIVAIQYAVTYLQWPHNSVFLLICFQKANSYPFVLLKNRG